MRTPTNFRALILAGVLTVWSLSTASRAQGFEADNDAPPVMAMVPPGAARLSDEQLDQLLAPIALYADPLLAQMLPACTYPGEAIQAAQWLQANPQADDAAIDQMPWEPAIKAMAHYPSVLQTMAEHADWTQAVGAAFVNQQEDVMASIQRLRQRALVAQTLANTAQQQVIQDEGAIEILPTDPEIIYVPVYDPILAYVLGRERYRMAFGAPCRVGRWLNNGCDWHHRWVAVGTGWHPGWNYENRHWQHAALSGNVAAPMTRRWTHNPVQPRPMLPQALIHPVRGVHPGGPSTPLSPITAKAFQLPGGGKVGPTPAERKVPFTVTHPPVVAKTGPVFGGVQTPTAVQTQVQRFQHSNQAGSIHTNLPPPTPKVFVRTPTPPPPKFTPPPPTPKAFVRTPTPTPPRPTPPPPTPRATVVRTPPTPPPSPPAFSGVTTARTATDESTRGHRSLRR